MVCVGFSPVTDHSVRSQTQDACVQPVLIMIMIIIIPTMPTWSWESIQISSEQGRVAGEERSCGIEQTLLILKPLLENNRQLYKFKNFGVYCYCS